MNTSTWNRRTVMAAVCLGALLSAGVIGSATAQTPVSGGHFRRALSSDPANLDPALTNTSTCMCTWGGVITVTMPGQMTVNAN